MALGTAHEDGDGGQQIPYRHLAAGEDRAGRDGKLSGAALPLEDRASLVLVHLDRATLRARRLAVVAGPADRLERLVNLIVRQAHNLGEGKCAGIGPSKRQLP